METLAPEVQPNEKLSRYIFSKKQFARTTGRVYPSVFFPTDEPLGTSVYRTSDVAEPEIWAIGDQYAAGNRPVGTTTKARADLEAEVFYEQRLRVEPETSGHYRHTVVFGWNEEPEYFKQTSLELAEASELIVRPA